MEVRVRGGGLREPRIVLRPVRSSRERIRGAPSAAIARRRSFFTEPILVGPVIAFDAPFGLRRARGDDLNLPAPRTSARIASAAPRPPRSSAAVAARTYTFFQSVDSVSGTPCCSDPSPAAPPPRPRSFPRSLNRPVLLARGVVDHREHSSAGGRAPGTRRGSCHRAAPAPRSAPGARAAGGTGPLPPAGSTARPPASTDATSRGRLSAPVLARQVLGDQRRPEARRHIPRSISAE